MKTSPGLFALGALLMATACAPVIEGGPPIALPIGQPQREEDGDTGQPTRDRSMRDLSVLVVDNEKQIQSGMRTLLTGWGCSVVTADGYDQAAALFDGDRRPDIILVDYHLKDGETGDTVITRLHDHFGVRIPAVMISADLRAGVDGRANPEEPA